MHPQATSSNHFCGGKKPGAAPKACKAPGFVDLSFFKGHTSHWPEFDDCAARRWRSKRLMVTVNAKPLVFYGIFTFLNIPKICHARNHVNNSFFLQLSWSPVVFTQCFCLWHRKNNIYSSFFWFDYGFQILNHRCYLHVLRILKQETKQTDWTKPSGLLPKKWNTSQKKLPCKSFRNCSKRDEEHVSEAGPQTKAIDFKSTLRWNGNWPPRNKGPTMAEPHDTPQLQNIGMSGMSTIYE